MELVKGVIVGGNELAALVELQAEGCVAKLPEGKPKIPATDDGTNVLVHLDG